MKKIYLFFQKINDWLASFGVERYLHLLAGIVISVIVCLLIQGIEGEGPLTCAGVAMMVTTCASVIKEVLDQTYEGNSELLDIVFTCIGGLIGCGIWLM